MNDETIKTLLSFLGGAVGLQLLKMWGDRNTSTFSDRVAQRGEWRDEVVRLREQMTVQEKRLDEWQARFYQREGELAQLRTEHRTCVETATRQEKRINELQKQLDEMKYGRVRMDRENGGDGHSSV